MMMMMMIMMFMMMIIVITIIIIHYIGYMCVYHTDKQSKRKITRKKNVIYKNMVTKIDDISQKVKRDNQYKRMSIVLAVIYTLMIIKYLT